jgi:hypothetical protein
MPRFSIDDNSAEALLRGRMDPDDAPPDLREVAALVASARGPASFDELVGESETVRLIGSAIGEEATPSRAGSCRRTRTVGRLLPVKVLSLASLFIVGTGVAAAATDSLPRAIQSTVSQELSHAGISVPRPKGTEPVGSGATSRDESTRHRKPSSSGVAPSGGTSCTVTSTTVTIGGSGAGSPRCGGGALSPGPEAPLVPSATGSSGESSPAAAPQSGKVPGTPGPPPGNPSPPGSGNQGGPPPTTPSGKVPGTPGPPPGNPASPGSGNQGGPPPTTPSGKVPGTPGPPPGTPAANGTGGNGGSSNGANSGGGRGTTPSPRSLGLGPLADELIVVLT